MQVRIRKADDRGARDYGWLQARYTFCFNDYYDPEHLSFRSLRVMNEDRIAAGRGFGSHPHDNMEILTYVLSGALRHQDSMGHGQVLRAGELQVMSAGTGITHSEVNGMEDQQTHLYQIWLIPEAEGKTPRYEQRGFDPGQRDHRWQQVAGGPGEPEANSEAGRPLWIQQDARVYLASIREDESLEYPTQEGRGLWLQVMRGKVQLGDHILEAGDGAAVEGTKSLSVSGLQDNEVMLFDLA